MSSSNETAVMSKKRMEDVKRMNHLIRSNPRIRDIYKNGVEAKMEAPINPMKKVINCKANNMS